MQVFLRIVAFSLQTNVSGRVVLTEGKRLKIKTSSYILPAVMRYNPLFINAFKVLYGAKRNNYFLK